MSTSTQWNKKHKKYATKDWIDKPTIFVEQILGYLPVSGDILELGTGQGQDARFLSKKGYKITAVDFSDDGLVLAREKAQKENLNINFLQHDIAKKLPFENASFDIVYSHLALQYFDDATTRKIFKELHRILRAGGTLAILLNTAEDPEMKDPEFKEIEENLYEAPSGMTKRFFSLDYLENITEDLFTAIVMDNKGETHKDAIDTLVRFIAKKI